MKVSYNWLNSYFQEKIPAPERVAELFNMHFAEVEGIEELSNDIVFDVKTLADRNHYALSHRGIARELGAITGNHLDRKVRKDGPVAPDVPEVQVVLLNDKLCRRYVARRIENVVVSRSPEEVRSSLEAVGSRSINSVVDATNFIMFDIGQPLHAFDADKVMGAIKVRTAYAGEKIIILDGREIELKESDLVIADDVGVLAIAGVKGGKRAEVTIGTTNIIIESANFDPVAVRRTSTRLNLRNDSSKRFENEITPFLAYEAIDRFTKLISDLSPGSKAGEVTDIYPHPVKEWSIECDGDFIRAMIGADIGNESIDIILSSLDMRVVRDGSKFHVTPPLERLDIKIPEDISDEVARIYGYDKLKSKETPEIGSIPADKTFYWSEKVKNILVDHGFSETLLYTLVPKGAFEVSYPLASDKSALRESIKPKLSESLLTNSRNSDLLGLEAVKIFEIGKIFPETGERTSLAIGASQVKKKKGVTSESILKDIIHILETELGAKIDSKIENSSTGAVIEIDFDSLISKYEISDSISDLDFKPLPKTKKYKPFSPYPFITRDIALFVPTGVTEEKVFDAIESAAVKAADKLLVKGPDLFDKFEKDSKVSYAFRMIFQSFEKTLSDEEVNSYMEKVYEAAKAKKWEVR